MPFPELNDPMSSAVVVDGPNTLGPGIQHDPPNTLEVLDAENGWIVKVGCKTFVFSNEQGPMMRNLIAEYFVNKKGVLKCWKHGTYQCLNTPPERTKI